MTGRRGVPPDPDENSSVCTSEGRTLYLRKPEGKGAVLAFAAPDEMAFRVRIKPVLSSSVASEKPSRAVESLTSRFDVHQPSPGWFPRSRKAEVFSRAAGLGLPSRRHGWKRAAGIEPRACGIEGVSDAEGER